MLAALVHCAPLLVAHASGSTNSWRLLLESAISVQDFVMLGVFCACFPPREARFCFVELWVVVVVVGVFKHLIMSLSREESALVGVFGFCVFVDPRF